jgi:hypothetical protein
MKEVVEQLKNMEIQKGKKEKQNSSKLHPGSPLGRGEAKDAITDSPSNRLAILAEG